MGIHWYFPTTLLVLAAAVAAQAPAPSPCAVGVQVCGTACCPPGEYHCIEGVCIAGTEPSVPAPPLSTSVTGATFTSGTIYISTPILSTWTPPTPTLHSTTDVSVSTSVVNSTVVETSTVSNGTSTVHSPTVTGSHTASESHEPTGAAAVLFPGTGVLGVAVAAALGAL